MTGRVRPDGGRKRHNRKMCGRPMAARIFVVVCSNRTVYCRPVRIPIEVVTSVKVARRSRDGCGQRLPLLIKGSCPSAHTGAEGIRTPMFLRALIDAVLQSLSQKSKIFASSLYTREPLGAPAPVHLSVFLRRTEKLYHIPLVRNDNVLLLRPKTEKNRNPWGFRFVLDCGLSA